MNKYVFKYTKVGKHEAPTEASGDLYPFKLTRNSLNFSLLTLKNVLFPTFYLPTSSLLTFSLQFFILGVVIIYIH